MHKILLLLIIVAFLLTLQLLSFHLFLLQYDVSSKLYHPTTKANSSNFRPAPKS